MKIQLFLLSFLFSSLGIAQFNPSEDWFSLHGFFESELIQRKNIRFITIYKSDKKDNQAFQRENKFLHFAFSTEGKLLESRKFIELSGRTDTSTYTFKYEGSRLTSRTENEGPFCFSYTFGWLNDSTIQETKIDEKTSDTNYIHHITVQQETSLKKKYTHYNSIGRPMKFQWISEDALGNVIAERYSYSRSLSFVVDSFSYNGNLLINRLTWNTIGVQKRTVWEFTHENGMLDFIKEVDDGELVAKFAILYNDNQLIKSIVKRNVKEKTISIYRVEYNYYPI